MEIFKKRESVIQNIAYMAIMSAINIIFVLLSNLLPALMLLLVFILPLTSTIVTIYCKKKYYLIYAITTLGLCIAVGSGFYLFDSLIYIIPSLIVGFLFGFSFEKKIPAILILIYTTIIQFGVSMLTSYLLGLIVINNNIFNALINLFGLSNFTYSNVFPLIFVYIVAQIQIVLSYIFVKIQLNKLGIAVNLKCQSRYWLYLVSILSIILAVITYFYCYSWTLVFVIMPLPLYVYETSQLLLKRKTILYVSLTFVHLSFIFIFAFLYQYVLAPNQLILITIITGSVTIIDFLDNYCFIKKSK